VNKQVLSTAFRAHFYHMMKHVSDSVAGGCVSIAVCRGVLYTRRTVVH